MKKTFVLDTNVLIHNPHALESFQDNTVVVPIAVIEELDTFKKYQDERGRNAREVARMLDDLRQKGELPPVDDVLGILDDSERTQLLAARQQRVSVLFSPPCLRTFAPAAACNDNFPGRIVSGWAESRKPPLRRSVPPW